MKKLFNILVLAAVLLSGSFQAAEARPAIPDTAVGTPTVESNLVQATPVPVVEETEAVDVTPQPGLTLRLEKTELMPGEIFALSWTIAELGTDEKLNQMELEICVPPDVNSVGDTEKAFNGESGCWRDGMKGVEGSLSWQLGEAASGKMAITAILWNGEVKAAEGSVDFYAGIQDPETPEVKINLDQTAILAKNKDQITTTLHIAGFESKRTSGQLTLEVCLLDAIQPANVERLGALKEESGCYRQAIDQADVTLDWNLQKDGINDQTALQYALFDGETLISAEVVDIFFQASGSVAKDKDNRIEAKDGKMKIDFPQNASTRNLDITIRSDFDDSGEIAGKPVRLNAFDAETGEMVKEFEGEVVLEMSYAGTEVEEDPMAYQWEYFDEEDKEWKSIRTEYDLEQKIIRGYTTHFSAFEIGNDEMLNTMIPLLNSAEVSSYSGGASYSIPINIPASTGSYSPSITLSYNSQIADSASSQSQGSEVGLGWALSYGGKIVTDTGKSITSTTDDTYSIAVGNIANSLVPVAHGTNYIEYKTKIDSYVSIRKYNPSSGEDYWVMLDKVGNKYTFGSFSRYWGGDNDKYSGWDLTEVEDIYGKVTRFTYFVHQAGQSFPQVTMEKQIRNIIYPDGHTRILFTWSNTRRDYEKKWWDGSTWIPHFKNEIDMIQVLYDPTIADLGNGDEIIISTTDLNYNTNNQQIFPAMLYEHIYGQNNGKTLVLTEVITKGKNGGELNRVSFSYDYMHLTMINNHAGANVTFTYEAPPYYSSSENADRTTRAGVGSELMGGYAYYTSHQDMYAFAYPGQAHKLRCVVGGVYTDTPGLVWHDIDQNTKAKFFIDSNFGDSDGIGYRSVDVSSTFYGYEKDLDNIDRIVRQFETIIVTDAETATKQTHPGIYFPYGGFGKTKNCTITPLVTRYLVSKKTVTDTVSNPDSVTEYTYSYEDAAVNNNDGIEGGNSVILTDSATLSIPIQTYEYSEYRGHSITTVVDSVRNTKIVTYYHQDDIRQGLAYQTEIRDNSNNKLLSMQKIVYVPSTDSGDQNNSICARNESNVCYLDRYRYYTVEVESTESRTYDNAGVYYMAVRNEYEYDSYGNVIKTKVSTCSGENENESCSPKTLSVTGYQPNINIANNTYLVGLPTYSALYGCPNGTCSQTMANLAKFSCNIYDPAAGSATSCGISSTGSITQITPANGIVKGSRTLLDVTGDIKYQDTVLTYDEWGNIATQKTYSNAGTNSAYATGTYHQSSMTYDSAFHNRMLTQTQTLSGTQNATTTMNYNSGEACNWFGKPNSIVDANGHTTTAKCDEFGRITEIRQPGDESGLATVTADYTKYQSDTAPANIVTKTNLNDSNYITSIQYASGLGQVLQTQQKWIGGTNTLVTKSGYDAAGRQIQTEVQPHDIPLNGFYTGGFGDVIETTYDGLDRVKQVNNPNHTYTQYAYDVVERNGQYLLKQIAYDPRIVNNTGDTNEKYTYTNALGQVVEVTSKWKDTKASNDFRNEYMRVLYTYDAAGNLVNVEQRYGSNMWLTTWMTYDKAGRKLSMSDPDMGNWVYKYDTSGNLKEQVDANGNLTCMWYDLSGRVTGKQYNPTSGNCNTQPANSQQTPGYTYFIYDEPGHGEIPNQSTIGQLTSAYNNVMAIDYHYNNKGQVSSVTYDHAWISGPEYTFVYTYYANGAQKEVTYPDGETLTYYYDNRGLLSRVNSNIFGDMAGGTLQSPTYDSLGRVTSFPVKGITLNYAYYSADELGMLRLKSLTIPGSPSFMNLFKLEFTYDLNGNISTINDQYAGTAGSPVYETTTYQYDGLNRLVDADITNNPHFGADYHYEYDYDDYSGNLTTTKKDNTTTYTRTYDITPTPGVAPEQPHAVKSYGVEAENPTNIYNYDANGNMTSRTEDGILYTQTWNAFNMLRQVTWTENGEIHTVTFGYDPNGVRAVKVHKIENGPITTEETTLYIGGLYERKYISLPENNTNRFGSLN